MSRRSNLPINEQIFYDAVSGRLYRRADVKFDSHGYRIVMVGGKEYRAHRMAWFLTHGKWPEGDIDHINRVRDDNRLVNIRDVTRSENLRNRRPHKEKPSKSPGVYCHSPTGRWYAKLKLGIRKYQYLGFYATKELATECHEFAKELAFG